MKIGVLALQGDFAEHITTLKRLGVETAEVRLPGQLDDLDGLILQAENPPRLPSWPLPLG